ncbi:MAG: type II toxin-antitoxin system RelE/ParE family toxin [Gammaproteobacteria bacterium]|nr:type II toxin-antitoxin system RelE/ParE family toxin [Gammaproteobacteria bacterium]
MYTQTMEIKKLILDDGSIPFDERIATIRDAKAVSRINVRIDRLAMGNAGDHKQLADNLWELRIDVGEGWRVYYTQEQEQIILLMIVGSKKTQVNDIALVKEWLK